MKTMESTGRNVDEAIFHGLVEMGLSIDQVNVEIVQKETKGIFGLGAKNAVVRLTEREVPVEPVFETVPKPEPSQKRSERSDRPRSERNDRSNRSERSRSDERRPSKGKQDTRKKEAVPAIEYDSELAETNEAAQFLKELLQAMKIEATVQAAETDDGLRLNILSETDGLLIGRRGETLDAIQYRRVAVDTEGYRARREETLRKLARRTAVRVAKTGRAVTMEPMNPYERRILHSSLQSFRGVTTYSEGEEPNRAVVIAPDK